MSNFEGTPGPERDLILDAIDELIATFGGVTRFTQESVRGEVTTLRARDSAGMSLCYEVFGTNAVIEGKDGASGTIFHTAVRDKEARPTKVTGFCAGSAVADSLVQELDSNKGGYVEYELKYDERTGLLTEILETYVSDARTEKAIHTNYFDKDGRRTGYIKREFVANAPFDQELHEITKVKLFEQSDEKWRETTFTGFRDGLIPYSVREYEPGKSPSSEGTDYYNELGRNDRLPYIVTAAHPEGMPLFRQENGQLQPGHIVLPAWIPKDSAEELASGVISPVDAAVTPLFPEAIDKTLLTPEAALDNAIASHNEIEATDFINSIVNGDAVIVYQGYGFRPDRATLEQLAGDAYSGHMSEPQRLAVLVALHPAFRNTPFGIDSFERSTDRQYFGSLLNILNLSTSSIQNIVSRLTDESGLAENVRDCFIYLLSDDEA